MSILPLSETEAASRRFCFLIIPSSLQKCFVHKTYALVKHIIESDIFKTSLKGKGKDKVVSLLN